MVQIFGQVYKRQSLQEATFIRPKLIRSKVILQWDSIITRQCPQLQIIWRIVINRIQGINNSEYKGQVTQKNIIMLSRLLLKQVFYIQPNRSHRYFSLTLNLNKEIPVSQTILQSHSVILKERQQQGAILLAIKSLQSNKFVYYFQSPNEIQPFEFYKQNPFTVHNLVDSYKLEEIQVKNRVKSKQLAPNYLRE